MSEQTLVELLKKEGSGALADDQDTKHAKEIVGTRKKGATALSSSSSAPAPVTTPPPKTAKPDQEYLGGYIDERVVDALLTDVGASRGLWNKTKLMEFILAKHYGIDLYSK